MNNAAERIIGSLLVAVIGGVIVALFGAPAWGVAAVFWLTYMLAVQSERLVTTVVLAAAALHNQRSTP